jgi:hypothetical protein
VKGIFRTRQDAYNYGPKDTPVQVVIPSPTVKFDEWEGLSQLHEAAEGHGNVEGGTWSPETGLVWDSEAREKAEREAQERTECQWKR